MQLERCTLYLHYYKMCIHASYINMGLKEHVQKFSQKIYPKFPQISGKQKFPQISGKQKFPKISSPVFTTTNRLFPVINLPPTYHHFYFTTSGKMTAGTNKDAETTVKERANKNFGSQS